MIKELSLRKFKRFRERAIPLTPGGLTLVAGVNNSGKSTILHALAVWEFCKTVIEIEKGTEAFLPNSRAQGLGLGDDEFSPILVPSLNHLWTNLKTQKTAEDEDGFTLRIQSKWSDDSGNDKELEFGLALANDRLFVKTTKSNLVAGDSIPRIAYLPPFAGITDREARIPVAIRRRRIGEGLAGAVLRNVLLDLYESNQAKRARLRGDRAKILDSDLRNLRQTDAWEILQQALRTTFGAELVIRPFRDEYHSYIKVEIIRGELRNYKIRRYPGFKNRDLMVEGSGFLQWLSVFALATDPRISTLLLDEPDAHLHSSLQGQLLEKLEEIADSTGKQILVATHSSEILRAAEPARILEICTNRPPRILSTEEQKVGLLAGLGSDYSPRIEKARKYRRILFIEGHLDVIVLKKVATLLDLDWPTSWVEWKSAAGHKERKQLFRALSEEIPDLVAISLRDRDDESLNTVGANLEDTGHSDPPDGFLCRKWRRRHIESYLLWPPAMAAASGRSEDEVRQQLQDQFAIAIGANFVDSQAPCALLDIRGKEVLKSLGIDSVKLVDHLEIDGIAEDLRMLVNELIERA